MTEIFHIFQFNKMAVQDPAMVNLAVWSFFMLLAFITLKKRSGTARLLERDQTVQLRGFAALFVMTSHFWTHASINAPLLISKGETVYIFLFFSGFGMVISQLKKERPFKSSLIHRVKKVMAPYWISTVLLIPLGIIIKNESYSITDIILTTAGINTYTKLNHIDYVRWYITFLIIWYCVFYIAWYPFKNRKTARIFLYISAIFILFTFYRPYTFCHQFTAFPLGCLTAEHIESIRGFYNRHKKGMITAGFASIIVSLLYKTAGLSAVYHWNLLSQTQSLVVQELFNILFLSGAIIITGLFSTNGYRSGFIYFCGLVSFPFFLLHGAFLIKFNPVIYHFRNISVTLGIIIFTLFILLLSYGMKKILDSV